MHSARARRPPLHVLPVLFVLASTLACSSGGEGDDLGACVADLDLSCSPLYTPTFDELHTRTLAPTCAVSGGSCHSSEGAKAGLVLEDADTAYAMLLGSHGAPQRVIPGDPACSLLVKRLEADSLSRVMPPGDPLSAAERCVFVKWIEAGAPR